MSPSAITLLLVDPCGDALAETVQQELPQLEVTVAASDTAARAYLGASAFDVIAVGGSMPDGTAASLEALAAALGRTPRVLSDAPDQGLSDWLRGRLALRATDGGEASPEAAAERQDVLKAVSSELARIAHALNNPLAVIDGNAQLALELSRALGADGSIVSAIEDIQGGSQSLAALFAELAALRKRVDALIA